MSKYPSKPRYGAGRPEREGYKPRGAAKKPWERREGPPREDRPEHGYRKPFEEKRSFSGPKREFGERRSFSGPRREFGERREFHPPHGEDELFTASGKVADIVGPEPQSRHNMLHKLWDFFRAERLVIPAPRRPRANADDWRHSAGEDKGRDDREERPVQRLARKPTGEHPTARKTREIAAIPHRKFKETRER